MSEKRTRTCRKLLRILIVLMLCWIWGNSMVSQTMSTRISNKFKNEIRPFYYALVSQPATPAPTATPTVAPTETATSGEVTTKTARTEETKPTPKSTATPATTTKKKDVRKYAHFAEFAALGILAALYALTYGRATVQRFVNTLSFGLAVAVTDESIQILSGRGPEVKDILLDCAGYAAGVILIMATIYPFLCHKGTIGKETRMG